MIQMNVGDHAGSENGVPFTAILAKDRAQVAWARSKAFWITRNIPGANRYFRSLPLGRSLTDILNDGTIWINFDPTLDNHTFGFTFANSDIWVGPFPFRIGRWTVLATIIHELAHIDGAVGGAACTPDGAGCADAERAVLECGLGKRSELRTGVDDPSTPYDPTIRG